MRPNLSHTTIMKKNIREIILRSLTAHGAMTISEIAEREKMERSKVANNMPHLLNENLTAHAGKCEITGQRLYKVTVDGKHYRPKTKEAPVVEEAPKEELIVCLAHGAGDEHRCQKAYECQRHLALRASKFPDDATIVGSACVSNEYLLFVPAN